MGVKAVEPFGYARASGSGAGEICVRVDSVSFFPLKITILSRIKEMCGRSLVSEVGVMDGGWLRETVHFFSLCLRLVGYKNCWRIELLVA